MRRVGLSLATAAAVCLVFPFVLPWRPGVEAWAAGWHEPLVLVALVPLLHATGDLGARRAFLLGFLSGTVAFLGILHWIPVATSTFGGMPGWASAGLLLAGAASCGVWWGVATGTGAWLRRTLAWPAWIVLPPVWVATEILRENLFPVFPWGHLGHALARTPILAQLAALGGVSLVAAVVVLCNAAVYEAVVAKATSDDRGPRGDGRGRIGLALAAAVLILATGWGGARLGWIARAEADAPLLTVAVVQPNIDQRIKNARGDHAAVILEAHVAPSLEAARSGAELVVWPEAALPRRLSERPTHLRSVHGLFALNGTHDAHLLLTGVPASRAGEDWHLMNSVLLVDGTLEVLDRYDKVRLVPLAETMPFAGVLPMRRILPGAGRFVPGDGPRALMLSTPERPVRLGAYVCYDAVFPEVSRGLVRDGAEILVLPTNDAWYGRSAAAFQFLRITAMRSVETGRWTARAANTGVSGFIDAAGRVHQATGLGISPERGPSIDPASLLAPETVQGDISLLGGRTPYVIVGDVVGWGAVAGTVGLLALAATRRRRLTAPGPGVKEGP
jgi:apolipoprotein N-acyltransferase